MGSAILAAIVMSSLALFISVLALAVNIVAGLTVRKSMREVVAGAGGLLARAEEDLAYFTSNDEASGKPGAGEHHDNK
jgi:hypothetical protein